MAPSISLSSYTIRINDTNNNSYVSLDNHIDGQLDSFDIISQCLNNLVQGISHDPLQQRILRMSVFNLDNRNSSGIIETGDYGYESDLIDYQSSKLSYRRKANDAELLPFYFMIVMPINVDIGIVLLQRFGQHGIKTIFSNYLINCFSQNFDNFRSSYLTV